MLSWFFCVRIGIHGTERCSWGGENRRQAGNIGFMEMSELPPLHAGRYSKGRALRGERPAFVPNTTVWLA